MKIVLITGGAGYIGSMLFTHLINKGYEVVVIDLFKYYKNSILHLFFNNNFKFVRCDTNDPKIIQKHIKTKKYIVSLSVLVGATLFEKFKRKAISYT